MARPSYLSRRDGGRYFLQIRVGNLHAELYGRKIMRASLRTGDFAEARRRLVDNLAWAQEIVAAPDLEAIGSVIDRRLQNYVAAGAPLNERGLAERLAFEHQARHLLSRANERGYAFSHAIRRLRQPLGRFRRPEQGGRRRTRPVGPPARVRTRPRRCDHRRRTRLGADDRLKTPPRSVDGARHAGGLVRRRTPDHRCPDQGRGWQARRRPHRAAPAPAPVSTAAPPLAPTPDADRPRLSEALKLYLAPPGQKRARKSRGRADTARDRAICRRFP